jgi:hypothetical protein
LRLAGTRMAGHDLNYRGGALEDTAPRIRPLQVADLAAGASPERRWRRFAPLARVRAGTSRSR